MFVKHGDGKIVSVLDDDELTEEQKNNLKNLVKKAKKSSENSKLGSKSQEDTTGR